MITLFWVNGLPLSTGGDPAFQKTLVKMRNTNNLYSPLCKDKVGGHLLFANYKSYKSQEESKLLDEEESLDSLCMEMGLLSRPHHYQHHGC